MTRKLPEPQAGSKTLIQLPIGRAAPERGDARHRAHRRGGAYRPLNDASLDFIRAATACNAFCGLTRSHSRASRNHLLSYAQVEANREESKARVRIVHV